jgi:phage gpG-like protein
MPQNYVNVEFDMQDLIDKLDYYKVKAESFPMSLISEGLVEAIDDEIQSEGQGTWDPFATSTLIRHPRRVGGTLLQDTGLLANIQADEGTDWAEAYSPAPYAKWHVGGTSKMPKRNFLDINLDDVLEQMAEVLVHEVVK